MSDFRRLTDTMIASPQIAVADLIEAKDLGVTLVVNNRPEGERISPLRNSTVKASPTTSTDFLTGSSWLMLAKRASNSRRLLTSRRSPRKLLIVW